MAKFFHDFFSKKFQPKYKLTENQQLTKNRHNDHPRDGKRDVYIINIIKGAWSSLKGGVTGNDI